ncbi:MAG: nucleotidyl transferase AbiEii/AbiGii toxin family protein [Candidatus Aegiribacteria sp.]|nr:nucleotidyl transferase AbiEii/AbiGii toxin family protein [Candidatus Aegiribacteria sp.]
MNTPRNIPASVRQRLLNLARKEQRPFTELLQYYAMERFLYRLSESVHAARFVLKGAMMMLIWRMSEFRPTKDIDVLGRTASNEAGIIAQIREILVTDVQADGLSFDPDSIISERITQEAEYKGIRILFRGALDNARIRMQLDIGFGDVVYPEPRELNLPALLDYPSPKLLCYSMESTIAEKFEVLVKRGILNSRMKDFHDIWALSRQFDFRITPLAEAIRLTFSKRKTILLFEIEAFSESFTEAKQAQWTAFLKRTRLDHVPASFSEITSAIKTFLLPVVIVVLSEKNESNNWIAPGPWS